MKKRILSLALALVMSMGLVIPASAADIAGQKSEKEREKELWETVFKDFPAKCEDGKGTFTYTDSGWSYSWTDGSSTYNYSESSDFYGSLNPDSDFLKSLFSGELMKIGESWTHTSVSNPAAAPAAPSTPSTPADSSENPWNNWKPWEESWEEFLARREEELGDPLLRLGENRAKHKRLFGDEETRRYPDKETAASNMVSVQVPVWRLKNGVKVAGKAYFLIHKALAEDVVQIFTEIFNDPEQFPFRDVGGYSWRGDTATGEHNCGTAIDINAAENYQVRDGKIGAGSFWKPGENPYSIPEDGSVVRIFKEHGWSWGGNAWSSNGTDQTSSYHDYMHFSYMGG